MYNHEIHIASYQIFYDTWKNWSKQKEDYIIKFTLKGFAINGKNIEGVNLDFKLDGMDVEMSVEEMVQEGKTVLELFEQIKEFAKEQNKHADDANEIIRERTELRTRVNVLGQQFDEMAKELKTVSGERDELLERLKRVKSKFNNQ